MALTQPQATQLVTIMREALVAASDTGAMPGRFVVEWWQPTIRARVASLTPAQLTTFDSLMAAVEPADVTKDRWGGGRGRGGVRTRRPWRCRVLRGRGDRRHRASAVRPVAPVGDSACGDAVEPEPEADGQVMCGLMVALPFLAVAV
ncbi:MAG TPA: hypothetical protein VFI47_04960 [Acidimicrobiales bacterium]|nr:hypothetical protein [Acidimicrobiales bacterium]